MKIVNNTKGDLALTPEHVVPAMGSADIPESVLEKVSENKVVLAWIKQGFLQPEGEIPEPSEDDEEDNVEPTEPATDKPKRKSKKRTEIEAQATELELEFDDETSDADLQAAIEQALNA